MRTRHPLPRIWLMSDARLDDLHGAIARLPRGSGIVFRHYGLPPSDRHRLFRAVRRQARQRRHLVLLADRPAVAWAWGADGAHHRSLLASRGLRTVAVHDRREAALARRIGADLMFVSPVFATRSHVGARALGRVRTGQIASAMRPRTIALGGMNARPCPFALGIWALRLGGDRRLRQLKPASAVRT